MIKRENILKRIRPFYDNELIKVLVGLRRSGKSVLLHQIMDELLQAGVEKEQIIYMNFEDFQYSSITNAQQLYDYICDSRMPLRYSSRLVQDNCPDIVQNLKCLR